MKQTICDLISYWVSQETIPADHGANGNNGENGRSGRDEPSCADTFQSMFASADWPAVYRELQEQAIAYLFCDIISEHEDVLPKGLADAWMEAAVRNEIAFYRILEAQKELILFFNSYGIDMAIMKGVAVAIYYPRPDYRSMGDIDFLVPLDQFETAYQLMLEDGYQLIRDEENVDYHYTLEKNGIVFEIHKRPGGMQANDNYLSGLFQDGLRNIQYISYDGYDIPVMPDLQNGLVLLLHIAHHLDSGLGFRQIIDWMMFVDQHLDDAAYQAEFQSVLTRDGLDILAKTVTKMCQMHLGLRKDITWCADADEALCEALLDFFYRQGNFGVKVSRNINSKRASLFVLNPVEFMKKIQNHGVINWKPAKKHTWLRPFAWIYQLCKYTRMLMTGEYNLRILKEDMAEGQYRKGMKEALKVFESV